MMNPPPVPSASGGGGAAAAPLPAAGGSADGGGAAAGGSADAASPAYSLSAPSADRIQNPFLRHGHAGKLPYITKDLIGKTVDVSAVPFDRRSTMFVSMALVVRSRTCMRSPVPAKPRWGWEGADVAAAAVQEWKVDRS